MKTKDEIGKIVGIVAIAVTLTVIVVSIGNYLHAVTRTPEGARICRQELLKQFPASRDSSVVVQTVWTRTINKHWVAALVIQSKNLNDEGQITIVCNFKGTTYDFDRLDWYPGNKVKTLKSISRSPSALFGDLWDWAGDLPDPKY